MNNPLDKYRTKSTPAPGQDPDEPDEILPEDGAAYLAYRPANKLRRLVLRPVKDAHRAPAYQQLMGVVWDGAAGRQIDLMFTHATIKIKGRNLQDLARQLANEKVQFVQEFDPSRWEKPAENEPVIQSIVVKSRLTETLGGEGK